MRELAPARALAALTFALAVGCGGSSHNPPNGEGDGGSTDAAAFTEAPHGPLPKLTYQGGPLLLAPTIVTVTFAGDANASALETFDDAIAGSSWWTEVTTGFRNGAGACVGQGSPGGHVELTTAPATSYTDSTAGGPSSL